jgi:hypothetical protein
MNKFQVIILIALAVWSASTWYAYFEKRNAAKNVVVETTYGDSEIISPFENRPQLTEAFWEWEARGRLALIDSLVDDELMRQSRNNWAIQDVDLIDSANHLIEIQMKSYGLHQGLDPAQVKIIPLRGDANGLYIPGDRTIYLNSKMRWGDLSFERFVEVVLHENMHHIMTYAMTAFSEKDPLRQDFLALTQAAFFHKGSGMANDSLEPATVNPQELVAYRTQRAARYAGIIGSDLSAWEMSARTQEIRVLTRQAGL